MQKDDSDEKLFASVTRLPNPKWDFYWNHIFLPADVKEGALRLILTECRIGSLAREFALSKTIFFHGPPGTGKTSFAHGVCNEAAKRLASERCFFVELETHKLSSHWLGESQKLIAYAFKRIEELAFTNCVVFCLFDEVESLLTERKLSLSEANPVDVFRGVNEVLRRIDELSAKFEKVFCLATSNLISAVDQAFLDRTDRVFYFDNPDYNARLHILKDAIKTLDERLSAGIDAECDEFRKLVEVTDGLSGRQLRKLPIEAMSSSNILCLEPSKIQIRDLIRAAESLTRLADGEKRSRRRFHL